MFRVVLITVPTPTGTYEISAKLLLKLPTNSLKYNENQFIHTEFKGIKVNQSINERPIISISMA